MMIPRSSPQALLSRFEARLTARLRERIGEGTPPTLAHALEYAVLSGGARLRPAFAFALGQAWGIDAHPSLMSLSIAVELMHCASLVHDDLPCFDDAAIRRGQPSVHARFGQATAVLTGDALIALAFGELVADKDPASLELVAAMARLVGPNRGIIGGQALELEPEIDDVADYHDQKTGALFALLGFAVAHLAGAPTLPWERWGRGIGRIYQRCDDLSDLVRPALTGKPRGQDRRHDRPSWASNQPTEVTLAAMARSLDADISHLTATAPTCPARDPILAWTRGFRQRVQRYAGQLTSASL